VGEHQKGLYALPSLVDKNTPRISTSPPIKLLDGPTGEQNSNQDTDPRTVYIKDVLQEHPGIMLGHYNMPNEGNGNLQLSPTPSGSKGVQSLATIHNYNDGYGLLANNEKNAADIGVQTDPELVEIGIDQRTNGNTINRTKTIILQNSNKVQAFYLVTNNLILSQNTFI